MKKVDQLIDQISQHRWLLHLLFWAGFWFIAPVTSTQGLAEMGQAFIFRGIGIPAKMMATYLLVYFQIPHLLQKKKYIWFVGSLLVSILIFTVLARFINIHIAERLTDPQGPRESFVQIIREFEYTILGYFGRVYGVAFLFLFIKMIKDRGEEKQKIERLKQEKATAELSFLKAQIHPHFLFNTLNNLYALTLDKSDQAPQVVAKLAEILDYMLYQCQADKVSIRHEIALIEHYIDLERLRYGERLQLDFAHSVDDWQTSVAPLILISIVENAFKHGVSGVVGPAVVVISLTVKDGSLHFRVLNTKPSVSQDDQMNYRAGIGVQNAQRQLDLTYPHQYKWLVDEQEETYEVNLSL